MSVYSPLWTAGAPVDGEVLDWLIGHRLTAGTIDSATLDGRAVVVSGSFDRTLRLWDVETGALVRVLGGAGQWFSQVRCTMLGDRNIAVAASTDRTVQVIDLASGELIWAFKGHTGGALSVDVAEVDGRTVAVVGCGDKKIRVWDLDTGKRVRIIAWHGGKFEDLDCVTLDGRPVAVTRNSQGTFLIFDLATGDFVRQTQRRAASGVCAEVGGRVLLAYHQKGDYIVVVDLADDSTVLRLPYERPVRNSMRLTEIDGAPRLLFTQEDTVHAVDPRDGTKIAAFDNDDARATTALTTVAHDGRTVLIGSQHSGTLRAWEWEGGEPLHTITGHYRPVERLDTVDVDGRTAVVSWSKDQTVRVWDGATGQPLRTLSGFASEVRARDCVVLNGRPVAVAGHYEHSFHLWDLTTGKPIPPQTPSTRGRPLDALSCGRLDGEPVVAVHGYRSVKVWDIHCDQLLHDIPTGFLSALTCTEVDGTPALITSSSSSSVMLWDLATGKQLLFPVPVHEGRISALVATTVDDAAVAVSGGVDNTVRVLDLSTRTVLHTLAGHTDTVDVVAAGELDGRPVAASGSRDHTVRIWDILSGRQTHVFELPGAVSAVAIGDGLVFTAHGREIRAYRLRET